MTAATMRRHAVFGLSIALALVLLMLAGILFRQGAFSRNTSVYFITESASGLTRNSPCRRPIGMRTRKLPAASLLAFTNSRSFNNS
jgi:hypothetical protein